MILERLSDILRSVLPPERGILGTTSYLVTRNSNIAWHYYHIGKPWLDYVSTLALQASNLTGG